MKIAAVFTALFFMFTGTVGLFAEPGAPGKKFNLWETPVKPRFTVTDRAWPKAGEAAICLWEDDKLAALSITIDDNCAMDVPFWLEQSRLYNLKVNWFLIAGSVGKDNPGMYGTWDIYKKVLAEGQGVESHSYSHWHTFNKDGTPPPGWSYEWECTESIKTLEANLPGHKIRFLAYAGGAKYSNNNDPKAAGKYFLAARGVLGGINPPNAIPYSATRVAGIPKPGVTVPAFGDPASMFDQRSKNYRGWLVVLFHYVGKPEGKEAALAALNFYKDNEKQLWGGLFGQVALYGQERDTASLKVEEAGPNRIVLELTDEMDDSLFDYPLTLKVRVPESWQAVEAVQGGKPAEVKLIENEKNNFALVKAVPDRGKIIITPKK